ncbi:MAG TPA: YvcK family protein [Bacillota bacterium]|nr:YvcK family protein [Bacillota bacterium]
MSKTQWPKVVVVGGGTGMPVLLSGLKHLPVHLTSLVNVVDDGGSTGRLRKEREMPAPGDVRNVIAALSEAEPTLLKLFQHRFSNNEDLNGHSLGNMLLVALSEVTGDFMQGIQEVSRVFNVKGNIYPISNESLSLHAEMADGTILSGESNIPLAEKKIKRVYLEPSHIKPLSNAIQSLKEADLIVISPGSLYTSILPNLIIPDVFETIKQSDAKKVYVCNVMTQNGETTGYTAADHLKAIYDHTEQGWIDTVIVHNEQINEEVLAHYREEKAYPVIVDEDRLQELGVNIVSKNIIQYQQHIIRHNKKKIAQLLYDLIT